MSSLEADSSAKREVALVPSSVARIAGLVLCQAAPEQLSGDEKPEGQVCQAAVTKFLALIR